MISIVPRHLVAGPDAAGFARRLSASVARRVDDLEGSSDAIDFAFSTAVLALQAHCVADPEADTLETWQATVAAMQLGSALFAVTDTSEGPRSALSAGEHGPSRRSALSRTPMRVTDCSHSGWPSSAVSSAE
ncbi:hypothetical protein [Streptomyces goshikiensis]|uniref:hypothetical protein n=1 Tax=Streptomyces goshikiensis TaxID=1942 RepID=UPI0036C79F47